MVASLIAVEPQEAVTEIDAVQQASVEKMSQRGQVENDEEDSCTDGLLSNNKNLAESMKKLEG